MPRKEIDYSKTVIYKIVCNDLTVTDLYVGHTTDFVVRKYGHKSRCHNVNSKRYNLKVYQMIRANGGWDNWTMVEVEKYPCGDGNEAKAKERYYLELLNAKLNSYIPGRSNKESGKAYRDTNKDKIKEYQKEYGKARYQENGKARYQENKEFFKDQAKKYNEGNKEAISLRKKNYYQKKKLESIQSI
jgi:hypothetical protein